MAAPSVNLLAWIRPEQVTVSFGGRSWRLHATQAADWIGAMAIDLDTLSGVFPGLVADEDLDDMADLLRHPERFQALTEVAQKVVQAAGGRDWWWTVNLVRKVLGGWIRVNGILVRQGVRVEQSNLPDWLDAAYSLLMERGDEDQQIALDMELGLPPRGARVSKKQVRQMVEAFQAD